MARSGDLSTIIESELSSASMSKHLPPLDTPDEGLSQPSQCASEAEEDGETLVLAHLAKQVHKSSASILRAQDLTADSSLAHPQPGETSANLSASWEAGLADFRRSIGVRAHGGEISPRPRWRAAHPTRIHLSRSRRHARSLSWRRPRSPLCN